VIVALLNRRDAFHEVITELFIERDAGRSVPLLTTWPVIAEAQFLPAGSRASARARLAAGRGRRNCLNRCRACFYARHDG